MLVFQHSMLTLLGWTPINLNHACWKSGNPGIFLNKLSTIADLFFLQKSIFQKFQSSTIKILLTFHRITNWKILTVESEICHRIDEFAASFTTCISNATGGCFKDSNKLKTNILRLYLEIQKKCDFDRVNLPQFWLQEPLWSHWTLWLTSTEKKAEKHELLSILKCQSEIFNLKKQGGTLIWRKSPKFGGCILR